MVSVEHDGYLFTTDKSLMILEDIHEWLSVSSYWATGVGVEAVEKAFDNSFYIGILHQGRQIGYARLITDYVNIGYLADVFVQHEYQGRGLGKKMLELLLEIDWVQRLKKILLTTTDAHDLYEQFGFHGIINPDKLMSRTGL